MVYDMVSEPLWPRGLEFDFTPILLKIKVKFQYKVRRACAKFTLQAQRGSCMRGRVRI